MAHFRIRRLQFLALVSLILSLLSTPTIPQENQSRPDLSAAALFYRGELPKIDEGYCYSIGHVYFDGELDRSSFVAIILRKKEDLLKSNWVQVSAEDDKEIADGDLLVRQLSEQGTFDNANPLHQYLSLELLGVPLSEAKSGPKGFSTSDGNAFEFRQNETYLLLRLPDLRARKWYNFWRVRREVIAKLPFKACIPL